MSSKTCAGIDYGHGKTNVDEKTGVRYGVISCHSVASWIWDEMDAVYSAHCPHCGEDLAEGFDPDCDGDCPHCEESFDHGEQFADEADCWTYNANGLQFFSDRDCTNFTVTKSPVKIRSQFCSPCYPGAGNLDCPMEFGSEDGAITYALPVDFFDEFSPCPYEKQIIE